MFEFAGQGWGSGKYAFHMFDFCLKHISGNGTAHFTFQSPLIQPVLCFSKKFVCAFHMFDLLGAICKVVEDMHFTLLSPLNVNPLVLTMSLC